MSFARDSISKMPTAKMLTYCLPVARILALAVIGLFLLGCDSKPKLSQISGKVTFKDQPVPAGYVSLTPSLEAGTEGKIRVFMIKAGVYDSSTDAEPGIAPGTYNIDIAGSMASRFRCIIKGSKFSIR